MVIFRATGNGRDIEALIGLLSLLIIVCVYLTRALVSRFTSGRYHVVIVRGCCILRRQGNVHIPSQWPLQNVDLMVCSITEYFEV